jgi:hypothetical protein
MGTTSGRWSAYVRDLRRVTVLFAPFHLAVAALTWDAVEGPGLVTLRIAGGVSTLGAAVSILYRASASLNSGAPRRGAAMVGAGLGVIGGVLTVLVTVLSVAVSGPIPGELVTAVVFAFAGVAAWWVTRIKG